MQQPGATPQVTWRQIRKRWRRDID